MILIVSYEEDKHAQHVLQIIKNRGLSAQIINFADFPKWELGIGVRTGGVKISFKSGDLVYSGDAIRSIWYRRVQAARSRRSPSQTAVEKYVDNESSRFLASVPQMLPNTFWVSDPRAMEQASSKPCQLKIASSQGWKIPRTVFGNSPTSTRELLSNCDRLVLKPIDRSVIETVQDESGISHTIAYAREVSHNFLEENLAAISSCPVIVQELVEKKFDVRVTVVGKRVFVASIHFDSPTSEVDSRFISIPKHYEHHQLPDEIETMCVAFVESLGLKFGCIDLGCTYAGNYVFFEINPAGHGGAVGVANSVEELSDKWSFIFWELGITT